MLNVLQRLVEIEGRKVIRVRGWFLWNREEQGKSKVKSPHTQNQRDGAPKFVLGFLVLATRQAAVFQVFRKLLYPAKCYLRRSQRSL